MKCWVSVYDDEMHLAHAETAGKAKRMLATSVGCDFTAVEMRRLPAMDDLAENDANLIRAEVAGWVWCAGPRCNRKIHPYHYGERDQGIGLEAYDDNDDSILEPVIDWLGRAYCCEACAEA